VQLQRPSLIQEQGFKMNAQLYQSIKLMELPIIDLRGKIEEEIERNPALEVLKDTSMVSLDAAYTPKREEEDYFEATSDSGFVRRDGNADSEVQRKFIEGVLTRSETLQEHLLWQLRLEPTDHQIRRIGELLIQNLDGDGFHKEPVELLLKDEPAAEIQKAMKLIQTLEPAGTCTANYEEALRVQIGLLPEAPEGITEALAYLKTLERGKWGEVAKKLGRSVDEVRNIFEAIKKLSPFPGRQFNSGDTRYVVPDVQVIRTEGRFIIRINA
jgi:RNA polymerase sigma-54 factor